MKHIITAFMILVIYNVQSQDSIRNSVESPKIITKLALGSVLKLHDVEIKFVEVIIDSRCPKNVNCVRAGEAKVLIEIYINNQFVENKVIEFTPTSYLNKNLAPIFSTDSTRILGYNILPYPEYRKTFEKDAYYLQLLIEN